MSDIYLKIPPVYVEKSSIFCFSKMLLMMKESAY